MPTVNEAASNGVLDRFPTRIVDVIDFHDCAQVNLTRQEFHLLQGGGVRLQLCNFSSAFYNQEFVVSCIV